MSVYYYLILWNINLSWIKIYFSVVDCHYLLYYYKMKRSTFKVGLETKNLFRVVEILHKFPAIVCPFLFWFYFDLFGLANSYTNIYFEFVEFLILCSKFSGVRFYYYNQLLLLYFWCVFNYLMVFTFDGLWKSKFVLFYGS